MAVIKDKIDQIFLYSLIAIPTYCLCRWGIRKVKYPNTKFTNLLALISTLILTPILYIILIFVMLIMQTYVPSQKFDKEIWDEEEQRLEMAKYIMKTDMLIGKTRREVIQLLGDDYYYQNSIDSIGYDLIDGSGLFGIDPDILMIYFENEIVVRVDQKRT